MTSAGWEHGDYLDRPLRDLFDDIARDSVPAAGSAAATTAALASALVVKVAGRSGSRHGDADRLATLAEKYTSRLLPHITGDAAGYAAAMSMGSPDGIAHASAAPRDIAETGTAVAELASELAVNANPNLAADAVAAERLATAAADIAASLVAANEPGEES